jgi:hypothetical protein
MRGVVKGAGLVLVPTVLRSNKRIPAREINWSFLRR